MCWASRNSIDMINNNCVHFQGTIGLSITLWRHSIKLSSFYYAKETLTEAKHLPSQPLPSFFPLTLSCSLSASSPVEGLGCANVNMPVAMGGRAKRVITACSCQVFRRPITWLGYSPGREREHSMHYCSQWHCLSLQPHIGKLKVDQESLCNRQHAGVCLVVGFIIACLT